MKFKTFKGDPFEIGKQKGKIYKKNGMGFENAKTNSKIFKNQLRIYKKHYPEYIEELKGIAQAMDSNETDVIYRFITAGIFWFTKFFGLNPGCTFFGVNNKNGSFVGRNYDWIPETEKVFEIYKVENPKRNSFIGISDMGIGGPVPLNLSNFFYAPKDIFNDKGLFIGITFAHNNKWNYGLSHMHMLELIGGTCKTIGDAIKTFKKVPLCDPKNFFIADSKGDMAIIEHTSKRFKVIYPENNVLIKTNHYLNEELKKEDLVLIRKPTHDTFLRYYQTLQQVNAKKEKFKQLDTIKILGNKNNYACKNTSEFRTIWSISLDMKRKNYKMYYDLFGKRKQKTLKF